MSNTAWCQDELSRASEPAPRVGIIPVPVAMVLSERNEADAPQRAADRTAPRDATSIATAKADTSDTVFAWPQQANLQSSDSLGPSTDLHACMTTDDTLTSSRSGVVE